jgi:hypothetical protein
MSQHDTTIAPAASVAALRQPKPIRNVVNVQGASADVVADAAQGAFAKRPQTGE